MLLTAIKDMLGRLREFRQSALLVQKKALVPNDASQKLVELVGEVASK